MRALLDTNVMIDLFTCRPPEGEEATKLRVMEEIGDIELWVSAKSFTDVFYVMLKNRSNRSEDVQRAFLQSLDYLNVCSVDAADIREACERSWPDFEDCLVDVCAEKVKADYLLTRDRKGFSRSRKVVFSPKELFDSLETELGLTYEIIDW